MCRTFLTLGGLAMPDRIGPRGETPRFVDVGDVTSLVMRRWGKGGLGIEWAQMSFGLRGRTGDLLPRARLDRIERMWGYDGFASNLCAVPMYGYRTRADLDWTKVQPGWALGSFDPASGFLLIGSEDGVVAPIVADWQDAYRWLVSETREQMRLLRGIASTRKGSSFAEMRRAS